MRTILRLGLPVLSLLGLAAATVLVVRSSIQQDPAAAASYVTAPVEQRTLRQTVVVRGTIGYEDRGDLQLASSGRVTAVEVAAGDTLAESQPVLAVNGRPVVVVDAAFPFWRDLRSGDTGADVRQLERVLDRAGYDPGTVDGTFTWWTTVALREWQQQHGFPPDGVLRTGDTLVTSLPARIGAVKLGVGDFVTDGMEAVTITGTDPQVTAELTATDRRRVEAGQPAAVEVSATGDSLEGEVGEVSTVAVPASSSGSGGGGSQGSSSGGGNGQSGDRYPATIVLADQPAGPVDGADIRVTIVLAELPDALAVPVAAVVQDGDGQPSVRVLAPDGAVSLRQVKTGLSAGAYVAVTSGLRAGETVVLGLESR